MKETTIRDKILSDGEQVYKICFPTLNGAIAINMEGWKVFLSYPRLKRMQDEENKDD